MAYEYRDIAGSGNYDQNAEVMELIRHSGQNMGAWEFDHVEGENNADAVYRINTPFGVSAPGCTTSRSYQ